jgi:hypothetical protein
VPCDSTDTRCGIYTAGIIKINSFTPNKYSKIQKLAVDLVESKIQDMLSTEIIAVDNIGADIGGFLFAIKHLKESQIEFDYFIKLHSKGDANSREIYSSILNIQLHDCVFSKGFGAVHVVTDECNHLEINLKHFVRLCKIFDSDICDKNSGRIVRPFSWSVGTFFIDTSQFCDLIFEHVEQCVDMLNLGNSVDDNWCEYAMANGDADVINVQNIYNLWEARRRNLNPFADGCIEHAFERFFGVISTIAGSSVKKQLYHASINDRLQKKKNIHSRSVTMRSSDIFKRFVNPRSFRLIAPITRELSIVICAIAKNEEKYIDEWIQYHLFLGFHNIYIYDNNDDPCYQHLSAKYDNKVHVTHFPGKNLLLPAYNKFLSDHARQHTHVAMIDLDEFIVLKNGINLSDLCSKYINRGALGINWIFYGSNGLLSYSPEPVIERFTKRSFEINQHIKCIAKCEDVYKYTNPHFPILKNGNIHDTNGTVIDGPFNAAGTDNVCQINHYHTKSKEEYIKRIAVGRCDCDAPKTFWQFYNHDCNDIEETDARDFYRSKITNVEQNQCIGS